MNLSKLITEFCQDIMLNGGTTEFNLSGHPDSTANTIRVIVSRFNRSSFVKIKTRSDDENNSIVLYTKADKRKIPLYQRVPPRIFAFINGKEIKGAEFEEIERFSILLSDLVAQNKPSTVENLI